MDHAGESFSQQMGAKGFGISAIEAAYWRYSYIGEFQQLWNKYILKSLPLLQCYLLKLRLSEEICSCWLFLSLLRIQPWCIKPSGFTRNFRASFLILLYWHPALVSKRNSVFMTVCEHGSCQLYRVHHNLHWGKALLWRAEMQEMVVLSSYGSAGHVECSALRNVMACDDLSSLVSPNSTKVVFDAARRNPFRGQGVNFPKCLWSSHLGASSGEAG